MQKRFLSLLSFMVIVLQQAAAQDWRLAGNSNATSSSKLGTTNSIPLNLVTNNATRLRIATDGKVGVGTTAPQQRFHVEGSANQAIFVNTSALGTTSGSGQIGYAKATPTASGQRLGYFLVGSRGGAQNNYNQAGMVGYAGGAWSSSSRPTYLAFETTPSGSTTRAERLRINTNGNVGVGTTNPGSKLHVSGDGRFTTGLLVQGEGIESEGSYAGVTATAGTYGIIGESTDGGFGVHGRVTTGGTGVWGSGSIGVQGEGSWGVYGYGTTYGVHAYSNNGTGIYATSDGTIFSTPQGYAGHFLSNNYRGILVSSANGFYAGYFNGDIYATGAVYESSDARLKKNIKDVDNALDIISKLQPKHYEFRNDGNYAKLNLPRGKHFGLLAQDVEKVLPGLVKDADVNTNSITAQSSNDLRNGKLPETAVAKGENIEIKAVNYTGLIPIMIKAMQEQEDKIEKLEHENSELLQRMEKLEAMVNKLTGTSLSNVTGSNAFLGLASPNPVKSVAAIRYSVPDGSRGKLLVTDSTGRQVHTINLKGSGTFSLDAAALASGVYHYSLMVDGKKVQTQKMTVIR